MGHEVHRFFYGNYVGEFYGNFRHTERVKKKLGGEEVVLAGKDIKELGIKGKIIKFLNNNLAKRCRNRSIHVLND